MKDIEFVGEQPIVENSVTSQNDETVFDDKGSLNVNEGDVQNTVIDQDSSNAKKGSPIGKFKCVDDLYEAYNNLQSEFTRKSQRLSELEKDKSSENPIENLDPDAGFKMFLSQHEEAALYMDEIKNRLNQDKSLKNDVDSFNSIWKDMLFEKLSAPNISKEPLIQNLILKDNDLKNLVIENYMKQLEDNKTPFVMSSNSGDRVTKLATPKPDSFEDAKKVVLNLLS